MTREDVKHYLKGAWAIEEKIQSLKESLQKNHDTILKISQNLDITGVRDKQKKDKMAEYVAYSEELNEEIKTLSRKRNDIQRNINKIEDNELSSILTDRYINCQDWKIIISKFRLTRDAVMKRHKKAIEALISILEADKTIQNYT